MESVTLDYNLAQEERYLEIIVTLSELGPNLKESNLLQPKGKCLHEEIQGTMITNFELIDINIIPLSRTTSNDIEINIPVKVVYKIYKPGDINIGDLFLTMMKEEHLLYRTVQFAKLFIEIVLKLIK